MDKFLVHAEMKRDGDKIFIKLTKNMNKLENKEIERLFSNYTIFDIIIEEEQ